MRKSRKSRTKRQNTNLGIPTRKKMKSSLLEVWFVEFDIIYFKIKRYIKKSLKLPDNIPVATRISREYPIATPDNRPYKHDIPTAIEVII